MPFSAICNATARYQLDLRRANVRDVARANLVFVSKHSIIVFPFAFAANGFAGVDLSFQCLKVILWEATGIQTHKFSAQKGNFAVLALTFPRVTKVRFQASVSHCPEKLGGLLSPRTCVEVGFFLEMRKMLVSLPRLFGEPLQLTWKAPKRRLCQYTSIKFPAVCPKLNNWTCFWAAWKAHRVLSNVAQLHVQSLYSSCDCWTSYN